MKKSTRKGQSPKLQVVNKNWAALESQPLLMANPQAALPLLSMIGQAQLSIEDLLGRMSRQFVEQLLMMAAESVAGPKHPGRSAGEVRWHGSQGGLVNLGTSKLKVTRPRLRGPAGEVALPGYAALAGEDDLSRRIADVLTCNVSTRKYARVMYRCADEMGISRSAVSRHFIKQSAQALAKLMARDFSNTDLVAIYVDGIIVAGHHLIAAIGVDATGAKHVLGVVCGSSENAKVVKDLLGALAQRGVDMNLPRLWVIDGSEGAALGYRAALRRGGPCSALPNSQDTQRHRTLAQGQSGADPLDDDPSAQSRHRCRHPQTQGACQAPQSPASGCRSQPTRRAGGTVHDQPAWCDRRTGALSGHHQRDRISQFRGATCEWACHPLS